MSSAELPSHILANDGTPLAMFDISGIIEFFLRAYIEVLFFEASFEFARVELFSFDIPFERPGVLASQQGSTLTLNSGPNAAGRSQGNTSDIGETIHVKTIADGTVVVWSNQFNVAEGVPTTNPFTGVSKIVLRGGASGRYSPSGHLVYARGSRLFAVPFDLKRLETAGEATTLVDGVAGEVGRARAHFALSRSA